MSIRTVIMCDGKNCDKILEVDKPVFKFKAWLNENEWILKKVNASWIHLCESCKEHSK